MATKMTISEAFDKLECMWGIIEDIKNDRSISDRIPDIQMLLEEYHGILLNSTVEI